MSAWKVRFVVAGLTLFVHAGCAKPPREYTDPRPIPTPQQREAFGTIGVATAGLASPQKPNAPRSVSNLEKARVSAGSGALGAGAGAVYGLVCGPLAIFCVPTFAVVGGVAGLSAGMGATVPYANEEQVNSADITLRNALLSVDVEDRLVETVLARASEVGIQNMRRVHYSSEAETWDLGIVDRDVKTRILIATPKVALEAVNSYDEPNPSVRMEIVVDGQIFEDGQEVPTIERRWLYDSEVHGYFDWADDRGALVITEIRRAITVLGAQISADFLGVHFQANQSLPADEGVE